MIAQLEIKANAPFSQQAREYKISTIGALMEYVRELPYGRTSDRKNLSLVLSEQKGTCSSKHALIKAIAKENGLADLQLIIGIYKMNAVNTPDIGDGICEANLSYIPEAHCYLKWQGKRIDITATNASFDRIEKNLLEEQVIEPSQIGAYKVTYHQQYLKNWILREDIPLRFESIWSIREECIANLSN